MQTKFIYLALALLIVTSYAQEEDAETGDAPTIEFEDGIAVLGKDNFKHAIENNEFVLVKFFAPWCGHCKAMKPKFISAAELYHGDEAETEVMFADVDATVHGELAREYGVGGYPTLKFFINGVPIDFTGGREEEEIIDWIEAKLLPSLNEVETLDDLEEHQEEHKVVGLFFGDHTSETGELVELAGKNFEKVKFFHTQDEGIAEKFGLDTEHESFIMLTQFDEGRFDFTDDFTSENLNGFIKQHRFATVMDFDDETAQRIFSGDNEYPLALFVFHAGDKAGETAIQALKDSADKLKAKMFLAYSTIDGDGQRLAEYIGVTEDMLPCVRLVKPGRDMQKWKMDPKKEITPKNIFTFYNRYKRRKIKPYLKSAPIPEAHEGAPFTVEVVGDNFKSVVQSKKSDSFVMFYAPWCGHCKKMKPIWEELAEVVADVPGLTIAKMDATANEVKDLNIRSYPTLKFYPSKKSKGVDYDNGGDRTVDGFLEWLKENTSKVVDWSSFNEDGDSEDDSEDGSIEDLTTGNENAHDEL